MAPSPWLLLAPLLTGASVGLFVAVLLERDNPVRFFALLAGAALATFLRVRLSSAGARARVLSGNFPFGCFRAPKTPEEFSQQLYDAWIATGQRPTVVGSGWGWFIGRASARDAVFTHKLKGRIGEFTFLAGTELRVRRGGHPQGARAHLLVDAHDAAHLHRLVARAELPRQLGRRGQAELVRGRARAGGRPDDAPGGARRAAVARLRHHQARVGRAAGAARDRRGRVRARAHAQGLLAAEARARTSRPSPSTTSQGLREWLTAEAVLRVLFFGAARRDLAIGVAYVRIRPGGGRARRAARVLRLLRPHDARTSTRTTAPLRACRCSSTRALWCAAGTRRPSGRGAASSRLSDANAFSPDPSWLGLPIVARAERQTVNFELIFVLPQLDDGLSRRARRMLGVQKLCNALFARLPHGVGPLGAAHWQPGQGPHLRGLHRARARCGKDRRRHQAPRVRKHGCDPQLQVSGAQHSERNRGKGAHGLRAVARHAAHHIRNETLSVHAHPPASPPPPPPLFLGTSTATAHPSLF